MSQVSDIKQAASNFCNVCGILAGFAVTLIVMLLSSKPVPDLTIALLLLSAGLYINGAGILGNVPRLPLSSSLKAYNCGIILFHFGNVLFILSFCVLLFVKKITVSALIATCLTIIAFLILWLNLTNNFLVLKAIDKLKIFLFEQRKR